MEIYPASLGKLIDELSKLPGIGRKSAERLSLHILRSPKAFAQNLANSLLEVKEKFILLYLFYYN